MAIRNFWLSATIDGKNTPLKGGPRAKDGSMSVTLYQRQNGEIVKALEIDCLACSDGTLKTKITQLLDSSELHVITRR